MPLVRRKKVALHELPASLAADPNPSTREVFYLHQTGEIFADYESYSARMTFYGMKVFQCELTGKGGLDFFQALESERAEAMTLHARFPAQLKPVVLRAVQWQIMGRLDHLVELVYDRFVNRYFQGEKVFVDIQSEKYYARIIKVFPPRSLGNGSGGVGSPVRAEVEPHALGVNLNVPLDESLLRDDPMSYFYAIRIIEEGDTVPRGTGDSEADEQEKWAGSEMEVKSNSMSRDRLSFSKSILRRFIRDCVDRDAAVASPWTVKKEIAERHGVATEMPADVRRGIDGAKQGEKDKRKKVWEDKHEAEGGPISKKRKRAEDKLVRDAEVAEERVRQLKDKEKPKPKGPIKYPIDDLDVAVTDRERKLGKQVMRPPLERDLPFGNAFEPFLMSWAFLQAFGSPMKLSSFTLDEYESALRHAVAEPTCALITEIHVSLIALAKERSAQRHLASNSLEDAYGADMEEDKPEVPLSDLLEELGKLGSTRNDRPWDTRKLKESDGRLGWESVLVGLLRDHATVQTLPNLRRILSSLLFAPSSGTPSSSSGTSQSSPTSFEATPPADRYPHILIEDKISIINFLCELGVTSRSIHAHIEWADSALTELRKVKIEVNREKKKLVEDMAVLNSKIEPETPTPATPVSSGAVGDMSRGSPAVSDVDSERPTEEQSDNGDGSPARRSRTSTTRRQSMKNKAQTLAHGKERAKARVKAAEVKTALAERRRLDEEVNKLERRLEGIEREFRQLLNVGRTRPMGKDRFYNRVWWLDGMGCGSLVASGGAVAYGAGRLFIQGPSEFDLQILRDRGDAVTERWLAEDGVEGTLEPGTWGCYSEVEAYEEFMAWLNPKGHRELALKNALGKWSDHITAGMKKRLSDMSPPGPTADVGRRSRAKTAISETTRESYLLWTNQKVIPNGK